MKYFYGCKRFTISPKVVLRRFELDGESTLGWGLSLSSSRSFGKGHKLFATMLYGDGIGRYAGLGMNGGAGLTNSGDIETVEFKSLRVGAQFSLSENILWSIGAGYGEQDKDDYEGSDAVLTGFATKDAFSWRTHIIWKATPKMEYAVGIVSSDMEVMDGRDGDMIRLQSYFKYSF